MLPSPRAASPHKTPMKKRSSKPNSKYIQDFDCDFSVQARPERARHLPHRLNAVKQLNKIISETEEFTSYECDITLCDHEKQVLIAFSPPSYYLAVAVPALDVFAEGHQAETSGHVTACTSVTPFHDKAGATERIIYKFKTSFGNIVITLFHTTRKIMIQGGVKNKVPQAPLFVRNILNHWLTSQAVGKDRALSEINQAILSMKIKKNNPPLSPKSNQVSSVQSVSPAPSITRTPSCLIDLALSPPMSQSIYAPSMLPIPSSTQLVRTSVQCPQFSPSQSGLSTPSSTKSTVASSVHPTPAISVYLTPGSSV